MRLDDLWALAAIETDECSLWPYASSNGYPSLVGRHGHVMVCERYHGSCPPNKAEVAHSCGVRLCVNPRHLRWATHPENMQDMVGHGHTPGHHLYKLTLEQVADIRARFAAGNVTMSQLGTEYGVTHSAISKIIRHRTWNKSLGTLEQ